MSHRMGEWRDGAVTLQKITKLLRTQTLNYTFNLELCELSFCSDGQITCYKSAAPPAQTHQTVCISVQCSLPTSVMLHSELHSHSHSLPGSKGFFYIQNAILHSPCN